MAEPGTPPVIGVIGGSGLYEIDGPENVRWEAVASPFGAPSDELCFGELDGQRMVFLPRHGRGHKLPPSEINFRANIDALKRMDRTHARRKDLLAKQLAWISKRSTDSAMAEPRLS